MSITFLEASLLLGNINLSRWTICCTLLNQFMGFKWIFFSFDVLHFYLHGTRVVKSETQVIIMSYALKQNRMTEPTRIALNV